MVAPAPTNEGTRQGLERFGFVALSALLVAPVVTQGLWRPLGHVLGPGGTSLGLIGASLIVAGAVVVAARIARGRAAWPLVAAAVAGIGATRLLAPGTAGLLSLVATGAVIVLLVRHVAPRLPSAFDGLVRQHPWVAAIYALMAVVSVISTARVSVYLGDPDRTDLQSIPGDAFVERHSCLTAYVRAASLARQGAVNIYSDDWWHGSNGLPALPDGVDAPYAPFALDNFSYPPPFLLVASVLAPLEGDFLAQRALWFGLNGVLVAMGLWIVAQWLRGPGAHRALLLAPLLFGSVPFLLTLQIGNFHLVATVLTILAMVAFDRGRVATGGLLLAVTILSKISPGILGVWLLARRYARGIFVTAAVGALLLAVSTLCFGVEPLASFVRHALPRLSTGRAFPFIDTESGIMTNMAPFGLPFKLRYLGLDIHEPWVVGQWIGRVYTAFLFGLALVAARKRGDRRENAMTWMALLALASLQSPFSPAYAMLALLWATTLLAVEVRGLGGSLGLGALWMLVLGAPPLPTPSIRVVQVLLQTVVALVACTWLVVRPARPPQGTTLGHISSLSEV